MRFVCLDTETTGLRVTEGHAIIDIGLVEILGGERTGRQFQSYLKCDRKLEQIVINITQITDEMLVGKPDFSEIAPQIMDFFTKDSNGADSKAVLVAHNAKFDMSFLNFYLDRCLGITLAEYQVIDTMDIIRHKFPGSKLTLDGICKRYDIDLSKRVEQGHGALLDAKLLADVFLKLTADISIDDFLSNDNKEIIIHKRGEILPARQIYQVSDEEIIAHKAILQKISSNEWL